MKCRKLIVQGLKSGSPWPVMECGGAYVDNGDSLIVDAKIGQRMLTQYPAHLSDGGECDRESLSGGHYTIEKSDATATDKPAKPAPKTESVETKTETTDDEPPAERADDRSMAGRGRRKKKKTTRK